MNSNFAIPNGDDTIMVELTVKEALALSSGARFRTQSKLAAAAKLKVRRELEHKLLPESEKIHYSSLEM
jgi:hypothetical protein